MNEIPTDLYAWRKQLRAELVERRMAVSAQTLDQYRQSMDATIERAFPNLHRGIIALCWPYKNEYDARYVVRGMRARGARTVLPVVLKPRTPMIFREWHPGVKMTAGVYGILYPTEGEPIVPDSVLLPMNGFDGGAYRLGYGGGFFDRTLASLSKRPLVIGVTFELARIDTIYPQPHDIPMDYVVTERGLYRRDGDKAVFLGAPADLSEASVLSSPVCYAGDVPPRKN